MISKVVIICVVVSTTSAALPGGWWAGAGAGGVNPWIPSWAGWSANGWSASPSPWLPWLKPQLPPGPAPVPPTPTGVNPWTPPLAAAPWIPQWAPCSIIGSDCLDCTTKVVCTKVGGIQSTCTDPALPYCNLGKCSATPTAGCGPESTIPSGNGAPVA